MHAAALADALADRGHRVLWWVSAFDHFQKRWIFDEDRRFPIRRNVTGYAIHGCGYSSNTSLRRFVDHRIIARKWRRLASSEQLPNAIVVAMPPHDLAFEAVRFAADRDIPSILNVRDPWPDAIIDLTPRAVKPLVRRALRSDFKMLREAVTRSDSVVSVSDSLLGWATSHGERSNRKRDRVIYTGAPPCEPSKPSPEIERLLGKISGKFVVAFIGTFGFYHSPLIAVRAARRLADSGIEFVLAGSGQGLASLRREAAALPNVHFPGWLDDRDSAALLKNASVGIAPATRRISILPNKAAAYLRAGLPIVSAFEGDLMRLIEERNVGFNYQVGNLNAFTDAIATLASEPALRREMSERALTLYRELFNADANIERFASHVEITANNRGAAHH